MDEGTRGEAATGFQEDLIALGFRPVQDRGGGVVQYQLAATPYLTYWAHWNSLDATVLFTWELAIGEMLNGLELQVGSNEHLNQFLFPRYDARGREDIAFVVAEMNRVEQVLRSIDFLAG